MPRSTLTASSRQATAAGSVVTATTTAARSRHSRLVLTALLTAQLMLVLDVSVMNVALPHVRTDLDFSATGLSWVMNAYTLTFGGLLLLGGRAGDMFGRRRVFAFGIGVFTVASVVGGLAESAAWLVVARIAQGIGAAAAGPSTLALLTTMFSEPRQRARVLALFSAMSSAGFAIGLIVGGLLTEWVSWRSALFVNVPFGIACVVVAVRLMPESARRPVRLDVSGAVLGTGGVAALVYGFIRAASVGWRDAATVSFLVAGALLVAVFLVVEARVAQQPLMPLRLFGERNRAAAYLNFFLGPMVGMALFFFLTQYLQEVNGYGSLAAGLAFLPMAAMLFAMTRVVPALLSRFGPRPMAMVGTLTATAAMASLTRLSTDSAYVPGMLVPLALMGVGMGLAFVPLNVIIMSSVSKEDAGAAGGVLQTMQQTGGTLGLAVLVTVFGAAQRQAAQAGHSSAEALVTGMTHAFTVAAFVGILTFLVSTTFRTPSRS